MSDQLRELYQQTIVDHAKRPRNFGSLEGATHEAEGFNPLCGDKVHLRLQVANDRLAALRFEGEGCAISTASASLLTEILRGKSLQEASALSERFHALVTSPPAAPVSLDDYGKLAVLGGVREFPTRIKCATLVWHTLKAALAGQTAPVSTE